MNSRLLNQLVENKIKYNFIFTLIAKDTSKMRCLIIIIYNLHIPLSENPVLLT